MTALSGSCGFTGQVTIDNTGLQQATAEGQRARTERFVQAQVPHSEQDQRYQRTAPRSPAL